MSVKVYAVIFGIIFLLVGILSYLPQLAHNGYLLNVFTVNPYHSILYIITGIIGLLVAFNAHYARMYFRVFGIFYLFLALLAFMVGSDLVYMRLSHGDNLFHLIVSLIFLYFGFGKPRHNYERRGDLVESGNVRRTERVDRTRIDSTQTDTDPTKDHTDHVDRP